MTIFCEMNFFLRCESENLVPLVMNEYTNSSHTLDYCLKVNGLRVDLRTVITETVLNLVDHLIEQGSDDTQSFISAISVSICF